MYTFIGLFFSFFIKLQIFEMMDAKARQDCIKEIGLLQVCMIVKDEGGGSFNLF